MKKIFLSLLVVFMVLSLSVVLVKAEGETSVALTDGVQIRTDGNNGLRWEAKVQNAQEGQVFGFLFAQGELTAEQLNKDTANVIVKEVEGLKEDGTYHATMINFPKNAAVQDITVRAYVKTGEVYTYSENVVTRNLAEVAVKEYADGTDGSFVKSVFDYLSDNYKKVYNVGDIIYLQNSVYEYEPTELAKEFIKDWNITLGESITTMSGFGKKYMGSYADAGTKDEVISNKVYQFFNANEGEMLEKWGWLLTYISKKANNSYSNTQIDIINGKTALKDSNTGWWGARHLLSRIENFFTRQKGTGTAFDSNTFTTQNQYPDLVETLDGLTKKFISTVECEYIKIGTQLEFTDMPMQNGYAWDGYKNGENYYSSTTSYEVTEENGVFIPTSHEIQYTITYKYNDEILNDIQPNKFTINSETFNLPSYSNEEFELEAWYDNPEFEGSPVTSIAKGTYKDYVLYAKPKTNVDVEVVYDLNGGYVAIDNFATTDYVAGAYNAINWGTYTNYLSVLTTRRAYWYHIGLTATEIPGLYVTGENAADSKITGTYDLYIAYCDDHETSIPEIFSFVKAVKANQLVYIDNIPAAATSSASINIKFLKSDVTLERYNQVEFVYNQSTELLIPARENYEFLGWYDENDNKVELYPGYKDAQDTITYKAKWKLSTTNVNVTLSFNGGYTRYANTEEAIAEFLNDYNTARGKSHTVESFYALGSWTEISDVSLFLYNASYKAKWTWLVEYIATVASSANKPAYTNFFKYNSQSELNAANSNYIYEIAYELRGWVGQALYSKNSSFVTADYSSETIKASALTAAMGQTNFVLKDPCQLPTAYKSGYKFLGWKSSVDGSIVTEYPGYTTNPGDITYTAQWEVVSE